MTYPHKCKPHAYTWTVEQIRQARQHPLKPLLERLGYPLEPRQGGNLLVRNLPGEVIIKDNYWLNHQDGTAGNAIDFFVKLCGKTFSQAMQIITGKHTD